MKILFCICSSIVAALLKCAFICAGIVDYPSSESLQNQLKRKFGSGFELSSIADIPLGSGTVCFTMSTIYRISLYVYLSLICIFRVGYK